MMKRVRFCAFLLFCVALALALCPTASAYGTETDFSRDGSQTTVTLGGADLLEALGFSLSETERSYLETHVPVYLRYEDRISTAYVTTHYADGRLTVYALPYSYEAKNGETVTWVPTELLLGERIAPLLLEEGDYVAVLEDCPEDPSLSVTVKYETSLRLSREEIASLSSLTYNEAERITKEYRDAYAAYEEEKAAYDRNVADHEAYLLALSEYHEAALRYEAYLREKALYEEALGEYRKYLADLELYREEDAAYRRYLSDLALYNEKKAAYTEYLAAMEEYETSLAAYESYLALLERVSLQLSYMQIAKIYVMDCCIYDGLLGPTVDSILNADDLLESNTVGADPYAVNMAKETSTNLKSILKEYFSYTTDEEKYNYYTLNYGNIVNNYVDLFRSLDNLYRTPMVRAGLITKGKAQKYVALLAELHAVCHLISDQPIRNLEGTGYLDDSYTIQHWSSDHAGTYLSPAEVLKDAAVPTLAGSVGTPLVGGYPTELAQPQEPTPVADPTAEKPAVRYPVLPPQEKTEPTAPAVVEEPIMPSVVEAPSAEEPTPPLLTKEARDLRTAYLDGTLCARSAPEGDVLFERTASVSKSVFGGGVTILFREERGGAVLDRTTVDVGTEAIYNGRIPTRAEEERAAYTFVGWENADGDPVDLSACTEDMEVYPHFSVTPKYFVSFYGEDARLLLTLSCRAGDPIVYTGDLPERADTVSHTYVFDGWGSADGELADLSSCTADLCLYPRFAASVRRYTVTFLIDGASYPVTVPYGEMPTPPEVSPRREGDTETVLDGFSPALSPVVGEAVYTACFLSRPIFPTREGCAAVTEEGASLCLSLSEEGGAVLSLSSFYSYFLGCEELCIRLPSASLTFSYSALLALREHAPQALSLSLSEGRMRYAFLDGEGGEISELAIGSLARMAAASYGEKHRLSQSGAQKTYQNFTYEDGCVCFSAKSGVSYVYAEEYTVNAISDGGITLSFNGENYFEGEWVAVSYVLQEGRALLSLSVTDASGRALTPSNGGFLMPRGGVDVVAVTRVRTFKIRFVSDGITLKEMTVAYGETPTPPPTPTKAADARRIYTFVGWSSQPIPATEDAVYTAEYTSEAIPQEEPSAFGGVLFRFFSSLFYRILDFFLGLFRTEEALLLPSYAVRGGPWAAGAPHTVSFALFFG